MRLLAAIAIAAACLVASSHAADNPTAGTWKLNAAKSQLKGPAPAFVHNGVLQIPPEVFTGADQSEPMPAAQLPGGAAPGVFKFDVSPDRRVLTVTRLRSDSSFKMVFDRQ